MDSSTRILNWSIGRTEKRGDQGLPVGKRTWTLAKNWVFNSIPDSSKRLRCPCQWRHQASLILTLYTSSGPEWSIKREKDSSTMSWSQGWPPIIWPLKTRALRPKSRSWRANSCAKRRWWKTWCRSKRPVLGYLSLRLEVEVLRLKLTSSWI